MHMARALSLTTVTKLIFEMMFAPFSCKNRFCSVNDKVPVVRDLDFLQAVINIELLVSPSILILTNWNRG